MSFRLYSECPALHTHFGEFEQVFRQVCAYTAFYGEVERIETAPFVEPERNDVHIYVEVQTVTVFQAVQELAAADASVQECREVTVRRLYRKLDTPMLDCRPILKLPSTGIPT